MNRRAFKVFNIEYSANNNEKSPINMFLNDKTTGEIYEILIERGVSMGPEYVFYTFFYEVLPEDAEEKQFSQKKITNLNIPKNKPKLL